ncbi:hypothetical protein L2E82_39589 [Cichorium intybus]|uniref:Uncharacterized protein n=1 Tax=Cichorium intybus TaxID=13427 RepID=A0ACB9AHZ0_CICIN|nr:hypothetical protein L2E82_39589 [Cichorium intybus]
MLFVHIAPPISIGVSVYFQHNRLQCCRRSPLTSIVEPKSGAPSGFNKIATRAATISLQPQWLNQNRGLRRLSRQSPSSAIVHHHVWKVFELMLGGRWIGRCSGKNFINSGKV